MNQKRIDIEERVLRARELFLKGYNCSQAVFCAYSDIYDIPEELALKLSASFGGGIGRTRETCGAVCGMVMLEGLESGQTKENDDEQKQNNYKQVQQLIELFKAENGSSICKELLGLRKDTPIVPAPDARTAEYYKQRPCLRMVESAARIFGKKINESVK